MSINLNLAFREVGLNARFEGQPAKLLPITAEALETYKDENGKNVGKVLEAGDVVVSWTDANGKRHGKVIDLMANNNISLMVRRSDGTDSDVDARNIDDAITSLSKMKIADRTNRAGLDAANRKAEAEHDARVQRGEVEGDFVPRKPTYADNAFANFGNLVAAASARLGTEYKNEFTGAAGQSMAVMAELKVTNAVRTTLTPDEHRKALEASELRAEIARLNENRAAQAVAPVETDRERMRDQMSAARENLPLRGDAPGVAQQMALVASPELQVLAFKAFTTTPVHAISSTRLGPRDTNAVMQELRRFEDTTWGAEAIGNTRRLLQDKMPSYDFKAKLYSRDNVDHLLVADQAGSALYFWHRDTRVIGFDVAPHLEVLTLKDVPGDEELEALRAEVRDLRYDNGGDVDFGFDDENVIEDNQPGL